VIGARCGSKISTCLSNEVLRTDPVELKIESGEGNCVAAFVTDKLSAKQMPCATQNYLACQGVGLVLDNVVDEIKVQKDT